VYGSGCGRHVSEAPETGRPLPGDFRFRLFGREWFIPLTTTLLLSALASLIARLL
jgi:hypothetical protein